MKANSIIRKISIGGSIIFFGSIIAQILSLGEKILLTRAFDPSTFGRYSLAMSIVMTTGILIRIGLGPATRRFVSEFKSKANGAALLGTVLTTTGIVFVLGFTTSVLIYLLRNWIANALFNDPKLGPLLGYLSILIISVALLSIISEISMGEQNPIKMMFFGNVGQKILRIIPIAGVVFLLEPDIEIIVALITIGLAGFSLISFFYTSFRLFNAYGTNIEFNTGRLIRFSSPLILATAAGRIISSSDIYLLGYFINSAAVGIYSPAFAMAGGIKALYAGLNKMFSPIATENLVSGEVNELSSALGIFRFWSFSITLTTFMWTSIFSTQLLNLFFGSSYVEGVIVIYAIGAAYAFSTFVGPVGTILQSAERTKPIAISYVIALLINIIGNVLAIPVFGIGGAAIATSFSYIILNLIQYYSVRRIITAKFFFRRFPVLVLAIICPLLPTYWYPPKGLEVVILALFYLISVHLILILLVNLTELEQDFKQNVIKRISEF